jgi:DNA primase
LKGDSVKNWDYFFRISSEVSWLTLLKILGITPIKKGGNFIVKCVFHKEKTPSLFFLEEKGIYKCFGCGQGGSKFDFVKKYRELTHYQTIKFFRRHFDIQPGKIHNSESTTEPKVNYEPENSTDTIPF